MQRKSAGLLKALWKFVTRQDGQDMVEYALIVALMATAATAGLQAPANAIYHAFTTSADQFEQVTGFNN